MATLSEKRTRRIRWVRLLTDLVAHAACDLPTDIEEALHKAAGQENGSPHAAGILQTLLDNTRQARISRNPLCQDTGTPTFWITVPRGTDTIEIEKWVRRAVANATTQGYLRRNTFESLSGNSIDNNLGRHTPIIYFSQRRVSTITVHLLLKGGGCENTSAQYALPDTERQAGRDLDGVRRCVLDAVWRAQGTGCAPGILGVCIGGDRAQGFSLAKRQLLRPIGHRAAAPELNALERTLLGEINQLGIGPMGLGGKTTLLDIKISAAERLPASFFVTVAMLCWAGRRAALTASLDGEVIRRRAPLPHFS